jgi:hypothetical protein
MVSTTNRNRSVNQRRASQQTAIEKGGARTSGIAEDAIRYVRDHVRENPENAALWCLAIGFVLGWKLKPW